MLIFMLLIPRSKMAPSGVSESVFDFENGLIVGLSWWGCSNADKQETDLPDEVAENSSSISVAVQTDAQRIHMSTMTDGEFPVFGYPSFRSKLYYLETTTFGFNNKVTPEMSEPILAVCMLITSPIAMRSKEGMQREVNESESASSRAYFSVVGCIAPQTNWVRI